MPDEKIKIKDKKKKIIVTFSKSPEVSSAWEQGLYQVSNTYPLSNPATANSVQPASFRYSQPLYSS